MGQIGVTSRVHAKTRIPPHLEGVADAATFVRLNMFPTPPWATRALCEHVLSPDQVCGWALDPCCGLRHMSDVLREYFPRVTGMDIHRYFSGQPLLDFLLNDPPFEPIPWIIMNPPFDRAGDFIARALEFANVGVAVLARLPLLEGGERFDALWSKTPARIVAPFAERLSMCCGGYDPDLAGGATHAWFVWTRNADGSWPTVAEIGHGRLRIIPPGREEALTRPDDWRFAARHLPGWIAPSTLARTHPDQTALDLNLDNG